MSNNNKPEPSNALLKQCADEIKRVLETYDVAAVVILQQVSHTEFFMKIDPSHSLASTKNTILTLQKAPPNIAEPNKLHPMVISTINMFANLQGVCGQVMKSMFQSMLAAQQFYGLKPPPGPPHLNGAQPRNR
jgi:hypothetical protein